MSVPAPLTPETLMRGLRVLSERDPVPGPDLGGSRVHPSCGRGSLGFPTLMHIILQQQVSLASAQAAYDRLLAAASPLTPARFLELDDGRLKSIGFSRQKTGYGRSLAHALGKGHLDLAALGTMDDMTVRSELTQLKGIGPWTASIYLLMALRRPDIWPSGNSP